MNSLSYNNLRLEREKLQEQLLQAQANLEYLKAEFTRQKQLNEEKVTAGKVFQKISADLKMEEAKIASLQSQVAVLSQSIALAGNAASPLINITAPISGHVTHVGVTIGAAVEPAKSLFSLADNTRMQVGLKVYEKDLGRVVAGQKVRFLLTNQGNAEVLGKVVSIGKAFEDDTKAVTVLASIGSAPASLIPGMYVNAVIDLGENTVDALPVDAIVKAEGKEFIFLLESEADHDHEHEGHDHAAEGIPFARIEVKTGESKLGFVQVIPLTEIHRDDKIVTKGAYYLQSHLLKSEGGGGHDHAH